MERSFAGAELPVLHLIKHHILITEVPCEVESALRWDWSLVPDDMEE